METGIRYRLVIAAVICTMTAGCAAFNDFQTRGKLSIAGLSAPVEIVRDEKGMAFVRAQNRFDAAMAQGFVTAQDRFFQMALTRLLASGRISELVGEKGLGSDVAMRTIGIRRIAERHSEILSPDSRRLLQAYADGVNAFLTQCPKDLHLEFKLSGIPPEKWTTTDSLTVLYYMSWDTSGNLQHEIVTQMLIDRLGLEKAREIFPVNIHPESKRPRPLQTATRLTENDTVEKGLNALISDPLTALFLNTRPMRAGSNNWVVSGSKTKSGLPIVANDPHLDARILPGPWYPCGIVLPDARAVGVTIPGLPGMPVFRNDHIAVGITNAYGDTQDLYAETIDPKDPGRYIEGERSVPFQVIETAIRVKDKKSPEGFRTETVPIRLTKRGPVISGVLSGIETNKVLSLRWSAAERMKPDIGFDALMWAESVSAVRKALETVTMIALNFVFADTGGNIGWQTTGSLPLRSERDGTRPASVLDGREDWVGWIGFADMPSEYNPDKGWLGTCNHKTVDEDYPFYYSSYFSPSFRYRRLMQLMALPEKTTADHHYTYQQDTSNLMAEELVPIILPVLKRNPETKVLADVLGDWDSKDDPDQPGPTIFHAVYERFARGVFQDELGDKLTDLFLNNWYFWQERLEKMVLENDSNWFDDVSTPAVVETRDDLLIEAALAVRTEFSARLGDDPTTWTWGKVHRIEFVNPIRRSGAGKNWVGGRTVAYPGSVETLNRGIYRFSDPFSVTVTASLRMAADLGDPDKILASWPGGVAGRTFHPHFTDRIEPFVNGQKTYWWFSDKAIQENAAAKMTLEPADR